MQIEPTDTFATCFDETSKSTWYSSDRISTTSHTWTPEETCGWLCRILIIFHPTLRQLVQYFRTRYRTVAGSPSLQRICSPPRRERTSVSRLHQTCPARGLPPHET